MLGRTKAALRLRAISLWASSLGYLGRAALLTGGYFLLAGSISVSEALAAIPAVALALLASIALSRGTERPLRYRHVPWLRTLRTALGPLGGDAGGVASVLLRPQRGFIATQARSATEPGQEAVEVLAQSLAPNGFVVAAGADGLKLHRLAGRGR